MAHTSTSKRTGKISFVICNYTYCCITLTVERFGVCPRVTHPGFCRVRVTPALVFSVVLCVLCLSFVSFCWPWSCLSSDLMISVCPFGIFEFLEIYSRFVSIYLINQAFVID